MELTDKVKPIYLGYDKIERKYWFYFIKNEVPRFLAYVSYFYWEKGPQNVLSLVGIPEAVELELEQFLTGNLSYEFVKPRKNSRTTQARKVFRTPQQVVGVAGNVDGRSVMVGGRDAGNPSVEPIPGRGTSAVQLGGKPKRKRRTKKEMLEAKAKLTEELKKQISEKSPISVEVVSVVSETTNVKKQRKPRIPKL